jgi:hypothetical protein
VTDKEISTYKENPNNMNKPKNDINKEELISNHGNDNYSETSSINSNESRKSKSSWSKVKSTLSHSVGSKSKLRGYENNDIKSIKNKFDEGNRITLEKGPLPGRKGPNTVPGPEDNGGPEEGSSRDLNMGVKDRQKPPRPVSMKVTDKETIPKHKDTEGLISNHVNDNYSETSSKNSKISKSSKSSWSRIKSTLTHTVGSKSKFRRSTDSKVIYLYIFDLHVHIYTHVCIYFSIEYVFFCLFLFISGRSY